MTLLLKLSSASFIASRVISYIPLLRGSFFAAAVTREDCIYLAADLKTLLTPLPIGYKKGIDAVRTIVVSILSNTSIALYIGLKCSKESMIAIFILCVAALSPTSRRLETAAMYLLLALLKFSIVLDFAKLSQALLNIFLKALPSLCMYAFIIGFLNLLKNVTNSSAFFKPAEVAKSDPIFVMPLAAPNPASMLRSATALVPSVSQFIGSETTSRSILGIRSLPTELGSRS